MYGKRTEIRRRNTPISLIACINQEADSGSVTRRRISEVIALKLLWRNLMGDKIAAISSPYRINNGKLLVCVYEPIWIAEFPYIKQDMLHKLNDAGVEVDDIRFTLSKISNKAEKKSIERREPEEEEVNWAKTIASKIKNETVRSSFLAAVTAYLARKPYK